eukprot:4258617-Amphidinium_carterae.1
MECRTTLGCVALEPTWSRRLMIQHRMQQTHPSPKLLEIALLLGRLYLHVNTRGSLDRGEAAAFGPVRPPQL